MPFVTEKSGTIDQWRVIDYERNIIFKSNGTIGMAQGHAFEISWNGKLANLTSEVKEITYHEDGSVRTLVWRILRVPIVDGFQPEEVKTIITEAFKEFGYLYNNKNIESITLDFPAPIPPKDESIAGRLKSVLQTLKTLTILFGFILYILSKPVMKCFGIILLSVIIIFGVSHFLDFYIFNRWKPDSVLSTDMTPVDVAITSGDVSEKTFEFVPDPQGKRFAVFFHIPKAYLTWKPTWKGGSQEFIQINAALPDLKPFTRPDEDKGYASNMLSLGKINISNDTVAQKLGELERRVVLKGEDENFKIYSDPIVPGIEYLTPKKSSDGIARVIHCSIPFSPKRDVGCHVKIAVRIPEWQGAQFTNYVVEYTFAHQHLNEWREMEKQALKLAKKYIVGYEAPPSGQALCCHNPTK